MDQPNLIVQTAFLGDLLLSIPLIRNLKKISPNNPLWLVARKPFGQFVLEMGLVERVFEVDKSDEASWNHIRRSLLKTDFRYVLSPHQSFRTAWNLRGIRAQKKVGFCTWWNGVFFSERVRRPMNHPDSLRQLNLLTAIDPSFSLPEGEWLDPAAQQGAIPDFASMDIAPEVDRRVASGPGNPDEWAGLPTPVAVLAPGSQWPTKRWGESAFANLAGQLHKMGYAVVLVGSEEDRSLGERIQAATSVVQNWIGRTSLAQLAALFRKSKILVSNDSGLMHLASACGLPVVGIFGPTTLELGYRPWQDQTRIAQVDLPCRPCGKHGHLKCPIGTHDCMRKLDPQIVLNLVREITSGGSLPGRKGF